MPAYDYDIIASFPSEVTKLIDFRRCEWIHTWLIDDKYQAELVHLVNGEWQRTKLTEEDIRKTFSI